jgi:hypothetical protein
VKLRIKAIYWPAANRNAFYKDDRCRQLQKQGDLQRLEEKKHGSGGGGNEEEESLPDLNI